MMNEQINLLNKLIPQYDSGVETKHTLGTGIFYLKKNNTNSDFFQTPERYEKVIPKNEQTGWAFSSWGYIIPTGTKPKNTSNYDIEFSEKDTLNPKVSKVNKEKYPDINEGDIIVEINGINIIDIPKNKKEFIKSVIKQGLSQNKDLELVLQRMRNITSDDLRKDIKDRQGILKVIQTYESYLSKLKQIRIN